MSVISRVFFSLGIVLLLLAPAPFAAAESCLTLVTGRTDDLKVIAYQTPQYLVIGVKAADPGNGATLILIIHFLSCTDGNLGAGFVGAQEVEQEEQASWSGPALTMMLP